MSDSDSEVEILESVNGLCPCCGYRGELIYVDQESDTETEPPRNQKRLRSESPVQDVLLDRSDSSRGSSPDPPNECSYIQAFFSQYPTYSYDPTSSTMLEFHKMSQQFGWRRGDPGRQDAWEDIRDALTQQFNSIYGEDENDLLAWQNLCRVIQLPEVPDDLDSCRQAVQRTFINIVDLVDTKMTKEPVRHFKTAEKLSEYTQLTGKFFPKENAYAGGLLKFLLRHIFNPSLDKNRGARDGYRPRKRARLRLV